MELICCRLLLIRHRCNVRLNEAANSDQRIFIVCSGCRSPIMRESRGDVIGSPVVQGGPSLSPGGSGRTCSVAGIKEGKGEFKLEEGRT